MALQIWLPLDGNLRNNGLTILPVNNTGAIVNDNGKIGQCYSFNNSVIKLTPDANFNSLFSSEATVAFWIKLSSSHNAYGQAFTYGTIGGSWNDIKFGIDINGSGVPVLCGSTGSAYTSCSSTTAIKDDKWHHLAGVFKNDILTFYLDGIKNKTVSTSNVPKWSSCTVISIGGNAGEVLKNNDCMNDIRLYNHALTDKEIKELSKGLVIHYPLNNNGLYQYNLIPDLNGWSNEGGVTKTKQSDGSWWKIDATSKATNSIWGIYYNIMVEPETTYTFSCDIKAGTGVVNVGIGYALNATKFDSWPRNVSTKSLTPQRLSVTFTTSTDKLYCRFYISVSTTENTAADHYLFAARPKLELGSIATPYSIKEDLDPNKTIAFDTSGYGNNGEIKGDYMPVVLPSPRYYTARKFNGSNNCIVLPFVKVTKDGAFSFSTWMKKDVIGSKTYQTILGGPGGFELEARNISATTPTFRLHTWGGGTTDYVFGEWTHVVFTRDATNCKLYVNGQLRITGSAGSIPSGTYFIGAWSNSTGQNLEAILSDCRVYSTKLSDEDVLELYNTSMVIDSNGNILPRTLSS